MTEILLSKMALEKAHAPKIHCLDEQSTNFVSEIAAIEVEWHMLC